MKIQIGGLMLLLFLLSLPAAAQSSGTQVAGPNSFQLSSTTFANDTTLPLSTINNITVNGSNSCSLDGSPGGNQSPELSWTNAPQGTASFVVTVYDTTAAFTHWGMYNISPTATGLPENAGVAGSTYGSQIFNDFFVAAKYGGTDGITPPFSNVTKALEVIPSKIKNPFCRRFPKNPYAEDANELDVNLHRGLLAIT